MKITQNERNKSGGGLLIELNPEDWLSHLTILSTDGEVAMEIYHQQIQREGRLSKCISVEVTKSKEIPNMKSLDTLRKMSARID